METITVTLELPVSAPLRSTVRALEAGRDAQADPKAKQALAMAAALASRGLIETLARSLNPRRDFGRATEVGHRDPNPAIHAGRSGSRTADAASSVGAKLPLSG